MRNVSWKVVWTTALASMGAILVLLWPCTGTAANEIKVLTTVAKPTVLQAQGCNVTFRILEGQAKKDKSPVLEIDVENKGSEDAVLKIALSMSLMSVPSPMSRMPISTKSLPVWNETCEVSVGAMEKKTIRVATNHMIPRNSVPVITAKIGKQVAEVRAKMSPVANVIFGTSTWNANGVVIGKSALPAVKTALARKAVAEKVPVQVFMKSK